MGLEENSYVAVTANQCLRLDGERPTDDFALLSLIPYFASVEYKERVIWDLLVGHSNVSKDPTASSKRRNVNG